MLMMIMFLLLIFQSFNLCFSIGVNIKGMQIAVKNDEINVLDCRSSKKIECLDEASNQRISCVVINYLLSHNYQLKEVMDFDEGEMMVKHYESSAFLYFPQNYTEDMRFYVGKDRENYDLGSPIYISFNKGNLVMKNQITKDVTNSVKEVIERTLDSCLVNPKAISVPMDFYVLQGKEVKSFQNHQAALFIALSGFYITGTFSVSFMLSEKLDGLLSRSMIAGVTAMELLISLFCVDTVLYILQMIPPLFIVYMFFSNPLLISGSVFVYFFILLILGWLGFFYGLSIAGIFASKLCGVYAMNGLFMTFFLLSGFSWPVEGQTLWLRMVSEKLPTSIAGRVMNNIALRGWAWNHPLVVHDTTILISQLILLLLFLFCLSKVKKNTWVINK